MNRPCSIDGCDRAHKGHGYCNTHYKRFVRHGDTSVLGNPGRPLLGDAPGWAAIHKRLMRSRGRASEFFCVDCGKQAAEWSYNNRDPHEIVAMDHGWVLAWSLDMTNYDPRCRSCHRLFDNAHRIEHAPAGTTTAYMELRIETR